MSLLACGALVRAHTEGNHLRAVLRGGDDGEDEHEQDGDEDTRQQGKEDWI